MGVACESTPDDLNAISYQYGPMFTLEESELLSRMLRFVGWTVLFVALSAVGYLAFR
jgi:hypothetical protein